MYWIKAKTLVFFIVINASYHICIICAFMNINKNAKKGKIIKSIKRLISSQYCHCCMFWYNQLYKLTSPFIQWSYLNIISFAYSYNYMKTLKKNEGKLNSSPPHDLTELSEPPPPYRRFLLRKTHSSIRIILLISVFRTVKIHVS